MKRFIGFTLMFVLIATAAYAGVLDSVKTWLSGTAIALILTGLLAIGIIAKYTDWISGIFVAVGWFLVTVGNATSDKKITKEELADMKAKWTAIRESVKNRPKDD